MFFVVDGPAGCIRSRGHMGFVSLLLMVTSLLRIGPLGGDDATRFACLHRRGVGIVPIAGWFFCFGHLFVGGRR